MRAATEANLTPNHHASAVLLGERGVLIEGRSGSGKTSLCHGLIDHFKTMGKPAFWISDDQVLLSLNQGRLRVTAPQAIAGKAELYGHGIVDVAYKPEAFIDLLVRLVPDECLERMPDRRLAEFRDGENRTGLPLIEVPERHENQAVRLVAAKLAELQGSSTAIWSTGGLARKAESVELNSSRPQEPR